MSNVQCTQCHTIFNLEEGRKCPECQCETFSAADASSKVFILQKDKYNVASAKEFGEIRWIVQGEGKELDPFDTAFTMQCILQSLHTQEYHPDTDFIALTGPSSLIALLLATVVYGWSKANVLVFDPSTSRYRSRRITKGCIDGSGK